MDRCKECGSIEGGFRPPNEKEIREFELEGYENTKDALICEQCGAAGGYSDLPEHDDGDLER